jgi:hypothetical protein
MRRRGSPRSRQFIFESQAFEQKIMPSAAVPALIGHAVAQSETSVGNEDAIAQPVSPAGDSDAFTRPTAQAGNDRSVGQPVGSTAKDNAPAKPAGPAGDPIVWTFIEGYAAPYGNIDVADWGSDGIPAELQPAPDVVSDDIQIFTNEIIFESGIIDSGLADDAAATPSGRGAWWVAALAAVMGARRKRESDDAAAFRSDVVIIGAEPGGAYSYQTSHPADPSGANAPTADLPPSSGSDSPSFANAVWYAGQGAEGAPLSGDLCGHAPLAVGADPGGELIRAQFPPWFRPGDRDLEMRGEAIVRKYMTRALSADSACGGQGDGMDREDFYQDMSLALVGLFGPAYLATLGATRFGETRIAYAGHGDTRKVTLSEAFKIASRPIWRRKKRLQRGQRAVSLEQDLAVAAPAHIAAIDTVLDAAIALAAADSIVILEDHPGINGMILKAHYEGETFRELGRRTGLDHRKIWRVYDRLIRELRDRFCPPPQAG